MDLIVAMYEVCFTVIYAREHKAEGRKKVFSF